MRNRWQSMHNIFSATVGSVSKGALWTVPFFTVLFVSTQPLSRPQQREIYNSDGYMELLPAVGSYSLFPPSEEGKSSKDFTRMLICNSELQDIHIGRTMQCVTTLSTIQTQQQWITVSPRADSPSSLHYSVLFCASAFAFAFPFTILVRFPLL